MFAPTSSSQVTRSKHKPHSRSNSISSSSVATTVKRTSSFNSSSTTSRPTTAPYGASAVSIEGTPGSTIRSPTSKRRSSFAHVAQDPSGGVREGLGNLNRWSQSTASSLSSGGHRRLSSIQKRLSGVANGQVVNNAQSNGNTQATSPRRVLQKRNRSPPSPRRRQQPSSPTPAVPSLPLNTTLPPIITLPSLSQAVADANTPSTTTSRSPSTAGTFTPTAQTSETFSSPSRKDLSPENRRPPFQSRTKTAPEAKSPEVESPRRNTSSTGPILSTSIPDTTNRTPTSKRQRQLGSGGDSSRRNRSSSDVSQRYFNERNSTNGNSGNERDSPSRTRDRRADRDKKAMLAKALQKANTAVVLDNAQNFEGAIAAYGDACRLLASVMERSSGEDDRKKLEAIRQTYLTRIEELQALEPEYQESTGKTLPQRPMSDESLSSSQSRRTFSIGSVTDEPVVYGQATVTRIVNDPTADVDPRSRTPKPSEVPRLQESAMEAPAKNLGTKTTFLDSTWGTSRSPLKTQVLEVKESMLDPGDRTLMPPPLSPRSPRHPDPAPVELPASPVKINMSLPEQKLEQQPQSEKQQESMSWLDTIDESDSSCSSSVHSVDPRLGIKRKHLRNTSGQSQAEFDAAFDAAVEAAYDDGFEPYEEEDAQSVGNDFVAQAMRNVELAKERVREAKREEAIQAAKERERKRLLEENNIPHVRESVSIPYGNQVSDLDDMDEEERMLDEMTKEYLLGESFDFGLENKPALPRQSDSSGYTRSTWESSGGSGRTTAGTSLSTVAEDVEAKRLSQTLGSKPPPVPQPPIELSAASIPSMNGSTSATPSTAMHRPTSSGGSVINRRFSGQAPKQLKIETKTAKDGPPSARIQTSRIPDPIRTPRNDSLQAPKTAAAALPSDQGGNAAPVLPQLSIFGRESTRSITPNSQDVPQSPIVPSQSNELNASSRSDSPSSSTKTTLKKNKSSISLSSRSRTLSISSPPSATGPPSNDATLPTSLAPNAPSTPQSTTFRRPGTSGLSVFDRNGPPTSTTLLPTPGLGSSFASGLLTPSAISNFGSSPGDGGVGNGGGIGTSPSGAMQTLLLTADLHAPDSPTSPNRNPLAGGATAPIPLEPCPTSSLLRPFWLLRAIYQTLAHPRGGYLSTKLFVPRDVWGVRGVKVRGLEEKISACDLLTAALEKVRVGWEEGGWEVDRVAEELSGFEGVMNSVQASLQKKLGQDVGVQSVGSLFRDVELEAGTGPVGEGEGGPPVVGGTRKMSSGGKNYLSGWRKLRSKNSGAGLAGGFGGSTTAAATGSVLSGSTAVSVTRGEKDGLTMSTLPMTTLANPRFAKRDTAGLEFGGFGPMGNYMGSLARLCDAVQVLDQIARQVEDPGLKHSSPAHVGLQLSAERAAEFFGFYICRFVLADVGLLLDKFIKRGSEWVLV
ncbi:MAG: hypothetical protein M1820_008275 [Bogoriella megaspora]|nr:MAG: hypothetical protein M1820_008275 [Bogoriella megaspora]